MNRRAPALPDASDHQHHDRLLIARSLDDDLDAAEMTEAKRLIEGCLECAALARDLRSISQAVALVPAARRTRDFRISTEQAAAIRGSFLTRLFGGVHLPRPQILQPLAGAAVAIGLVLLVIGNGLLPAGADRSTGPAGTPAESPVMAAGPSSDTSDGGRPFGTSETDGAAEAEGSAAPPVGPDMAPAATEPGDAEAPASSEEPGSQESTSQRPTSQRSTPSKAPATTASGTDDPTASPRSDTAVVPSGRPTPGSATLNEVAPARPGSDADVAALGLLVAGVGVLLLLARPLARRLERR